MTDPKDPKVTWDVLRNAYDVRDRRRVLLWLVSLMGVGIGWSVGQADEDEDD
jgi:hypothetical protein